jgi:hypothetical protein
VGKHPRLERIESAVEPIAIFVEEPLDGINHRGLKREGHDISVANSRGPHGAPLL